MSLDLIRNGVAAAARKAGRDPAGITLIAVSKMQPEARVLPVLQAGQRVFGENRVQEAQSRWGALAPRFDGVRIHVIGPLQTNKARAAMEIAHAIHSLDRPKLAETLARLAQERGACPELFVQVNTGRESQKAGVLPDEADGFVARCRELDLPVAGLMCIPPAGEDPAPHFDMLREMAARNGLAGLSMGMSGDYETAIAHGATHVRVGSAIFGARD
ncbi:YggS family pyridoxal phosphate-dependent enzyme [Limimaricola cinnabarinus]|jgi:pyridoxal phosphate enzyme (YggS family)|uniref:Pyridoxal phosphate homeostasis protein n=1 Tax=Limimaricola cinnabarinus TaxID=1125964 RepID=A0A2G1MFA2_9RHOB|nr:YggS family pyridoxal phosphate-dependent enzyme [Limimaricola cinnabarinus]PHP27425.1 YggS family pyridoxal phosphate-dependent enzyme [Limimaricola cinnabarinus]